MNRPSFQSIVIEAASIAQSARDSIRIESKEDGSVVTNGDREVETFLRQALPDLEPGAAFWGEEFGHEPANENGMWLIDPIDGTTNYSMGSPLWGVCIGFYKAGKIQYGAVSLPDLNELYLGGRGLGVTCNDIPMPIIEPGEINRSQPIGYCEGIARMHLELPGRQRCSGAFIVDGCFVLQQRLRGLVGYREHLYDVSPVLVFAEELGLETRFGDGSPLDVNDFLVPKPFGRPWVIFPKGCKSVF